MNTNKSQKIKIAVIILLMEIFFIGDFIMPQTKKSNNKLETVTITIVYDNNQFLKGLQTDWGFACLVEFEKTKLLFDTGNNGNILLSNMAKLNIDPKTIDLIFLSHFHHDHTGGLRDCLKKNSKVIVYYPQSFPIELTEIIKNSGATPVSISSFNELQTNIFSLGEIEGVVPEQSLAIRTQKGIVIITGCAHPGIIKILQKAKSSFPDESIYLVLGGFHLNHLNDEEINEVVQIIFDMNILSVAPTHCSGTTARKMFEDVFGADYIEAGTGKVFKID
jgi:7,8-dihydropterin-6-yl-methyl-4-(beta-D-ribofuranosyl)aminobenzene 5'-phosphate synthase